MIRSLRWRLQIWHALLLTTVLIIFGGVVHALQWQTRLQQTDADLDRLATVLNSRLRGLFPVPRVPNSGSWQRNQGRGGGQGGGRPDYRPVETVDNQPVADALFPANSAPLMFARAFGMNVRDGAPDDSGDGRRRDNRTSSRGGRDSEREGSREGRGPREGPPPGSSRDSSQQDPGRNPWFSPPPGLGLPDEFMHLFEGDDESRNYFIIWDKNGTVLEKSQLIDEVPFPNLRSPQDGVPVPTVRARGMMREVVHVSRFGDINVVVGRSIHRDIEALNRAGFLLFCTGLAVLSLGLAGGWWFSFRAIRPIKEMSAIAESISVKNLSQRINAESTATELEQLAIVLNRTFDRLQGAFERQAQFTADASHELRTPVSVILTHAELALSRPRSPEDYQKAFQTCRKASLRMKSLIDSMLLLARFDSDESEFEKQPVDLDRIANDTTELLQSLATERQVTLTCRADSVVVIADQERIMQLITNLISNAIRYNRPQGKVEVDVSVDGETAVIRVSDTGVGIAAEELPKIFDRFYRVDKARSTSEGGCGLGLAICQTIVDAHNGTVSATSELGEGTTIEVRLPGVRNADEPDSSDSVAVTSEPVASA